MRHQLVVFVYTSGVLSAAIDTRQTDDTARLERRQNLLGGLVGGLGSVLGGLTGGLGSVLGGLTGPLLNPLLGPVVGGIVGDNKKPGAASPPVIVVNGPNGGYGSPYMAGSPFGIPGPAGPPLSGGFGFPSSPYGAGYPVAPRPVAPAPVPASGSSSSSGGAEHTVSIRGVNVPCRQYPDDFSPDPTKSILLSAPAKIDAVCWSPTTHGAARSANEDGWLMTKANCFIKVSEVEEYRDYRRSLKACTEVRHWIATLQEQYTRKDCYYCPSTSTCGSEDLGSPPYVDLLCYTEGDNVSGNSTWYKNRGKECFFPAAIFDKGGWMGTPGGRC